MEQVSRKQQVKQLMEQGITSPTAIAKQLGTHMSYVSSLIKKVRDEGFETPVQDVVKEQIVEADVEKPVEQIEEAIKEVKSKKANKVEELKATKIKISQKTFDKVCSTLEKAKVACKVIWDVNQDMIDVVLGWDYPDKYFMKASGAIEKVEALKGFKIEYCGDCTIAMNAVDRNVLGGAPEWTR